MATGNHLSFWTLLVGIWVELRAASNSASFSPVCDVELERPGVLWAIYPERAVRKLKIETLCAAPPEALTHSSSQMPLSCPVAPPAARRLAHADTRR